jgi:hypothetical protein
MKPRVCEIFKGKQNDNAIGTGTGNSNVIKTKFFKKDTRPKSANGVRGIMKK